MPWPEKTVQSRVLAGIAGAVLGGLVSFLALGWHFGAFTLNSPVSLVLWGSVVGSGVGFAAGFWGGDPVIRFLMRLVGGRV